MGFRIAVLPVMGDRKLNVVAKLWKLLRCLLSSCL